MKKLLIILFGISLIAGAFATNTPVLGYDLAIPNNYDFTEEQIDAVLDYYRTTYEDWLSTPGLYSKGQTGLMLLDLFALNDTLAGAVEIQEGIIANQVDEIFMALKFLEESVYFITDNVEDQYDLIDNLYAFMTEGKADSIMMFRDSIEAHLVDTYDMTMEHIGNTIEDIGVFGDSLGTRFDTILHSNEDFTFRIGEVSIMYDGYGFPYFDTTEVAVIYDESFATVWAAKNYLEHAVHYLGIGLENILDSDSTMAVGLDTLMLSMQNFQNVCDTLNNYSMWSLLDSSDLVDVQHVFAEAEAMLGGKVYYIERGDSVVVDSIAIRPVGLIENIHYGLYRAYIDMYWQADPNAYTFRDIFPEGLPEDIIDQLAADMVIDPRDSLEQVITYFTAKSVEYSATLLSDPMDVDANVGLGYIESFAMLKDAKDQFEIIGALVDGGRIDSLFQNYDWDNLDYSDEIMSIRTHLGMHYSGMINGDYRLFTVLVKDPNASIPGHTVVEGDLVYPIYIIPQVTDGIVTFTYMVENAIYAIADGITYVYTQVDSMIDITLDPNTLNLSNIEEPLDLIYALEASNPNFGAFTPEGKIMFAAFGDSLALGVQGLSQFADTVIATVDYAGPLLSEWGMSPEDHDTLLMNLAEVNGFLDMLAADLLTPDVYSYIDNDTLNFSAWFDDVPDNMLTVWKDFFEGRDSSLAGFFPTKIVKSDVDPYVVPAEFALKSNYPNPFNPLTTIAFDLPEEGMVRLDIFNIAGRKVESLIQNTMPAGSYELTWNAAHQASGVYIVRMQFANETAYHKMTLLK